MKKILTILLGVFLMSVCAQAQEERFLFVDQSAAQAAHEHSLFVQLQQAVKNKDTDSLKKLLKNTNSRVWTQKDKHGNNLFHLCGDVQTFAVLHMYLASVREEMLSAKNKTGEIPWMSYIMYGKEDIFLTYFPQSTLYARLKQITSELEKSNGLNYRNALTKRDALIKESSSAGEQTLWKRADLMCKGLKAGAKGYHRYAYPADNALGMNNAAPVQNKMEQVRKLIEDVAPFLVK